jgi:EAL domain-containing protein (putative c-di-GMP-specific phosphodiesterase class I)
VGKFLSVSSPPLPSTFLDKKVYEKVKAICNENEIDAEAFIFEVLRTALNHHKNDVEQIIKNLKR